MISCPNPAKHNVPIFKEALALFVLLVLVCVIAWPGMNSPMLLDDLDEMNHINTFTSWRDCFKPDAYGLFRPVKNIIFYAFENRPVFDWHLLGLALYLSSIPVTYLFLRRFLESSFWAFVAVALWATSPTQASTVIWMSCANISLAITMGCACLYFHETAQSGADRYGISTLLACLTLFVSQTCYEAAVAVPILCVLLDLIKKRPLFTRKAILRYGLLAAVTVIYLILRTQLGSRYAVHDDTRFIPGSPGWQLSISAPWFLWKHFSMWLMPYGRIEFLGTYLWGISASFLELAVAWVGLLSIAGLIIFCWRRQPWIAFGLLWFLAASFPSSNFIPIRVGPIADYYVTFPSVGLAIALAGCAKAVVDWCKRETENAESSSKRIAGTLLCVGLIWRALGIPLFWLQADLWSRPIDLFASISTTRPGQFHAETLVAREFLLSGHLDKARDFALNANTTAPWFGDASMILGRVALDKKDYQEAENRLTDAIRNSPENSPVSDTSRYYLAYVYFLQENKRPLVRETLLKLLENQKSNSHIPAIHLHVRCYLAQEKREDALRAATKAAALHPNDPELKKLLKSIKEEFSGKQPQSQ